MPPPTRARDLLAVAVTLLVGLSLVRLAVDHAMLAHAGAVRAHLGGHDADAYAAQQWRTQVDVAMWLARLALAGAVVAWASRARRIVQTYDCYLFRTDPDLALSGWLIPGVNLSAPYLLMSDVWTASDPRRPPEVNVSRIAPPRRIGLWWLLFLLSLVFGFLELRHVAFVGSAWTPFDLHLDYLMTTAQLLSAGLLLWIVVRMTRFLEARYAGSAAA